MGELPIFFPYEPRPGQRELVSFLRDALAAGAHAVVESGTGTGKTVSALAAALEAARERGLRVLYLTRTHAQARQVMVEFRRIRSASQRARMAAEPASSASIKEKSVATTAVALQGRAHLCPLRKLDAEMAAADADELAVMCRDRMKSAEQMRDGKDPGKIAACPFHLRGLDQGHAALAQWVRERAPEADELSAEAESRGFCPHLVTRGLLAEAELVVAPYVYFLSPHLRGALLRWMACALPDLVIVVDEAHNLPDFARDLATPRLGAGTIERALAEARQFGDPTVLHDRSLTAVLRVVGGVLDELRETYLPEGAEDALLPPDELDVLLLSTLQASTTGLSRALGAMEEYAESVRQAKRRNGKVPRSYVGAVAAFLQAYRGLDAWTHAPLVERDGEGARLVAFALDPSTLTSPVADAAGSIHLSGTLRPLDEYAATIGLPDARRATFASGFPPENRAVVVDSTVTTRHEDVQRDPALWGAIGRRLQELRAATDRSMAVFLPSYDVLHRLAPYLRSQGALVETRGGRQDELMAQVRAFKARRGGTLVSVIGGRLSEGLDFPDDELEVVVLVGLPYPKPSARVEALVRFYDRRFGRGWDWAVRAPMERRMLQAAGRLIRSPTDRGVVVILDRRASALIDAFPEARATEEPADAMRRFWGPDSCRGAALERPRNPSGPSPRRPGAQHQQEDGPPAQGRPHDRGQAGGL